MKLKNSRSIYNRYRNLLSNRPNFSSLDELWIVCNNFSELSDTDKDFFLQKIKKCHNSWNTIENYWFIRLSKNIIPFLSELQRQEYINIIEDVDVSKRDTLILNEILEIITLLYKYSINTAEKKKLVKYVLKNLHYLKSEESLLHLSETIDNLLFELTVEEKDIFFSTLLNHIQTKGDNLNEITIDYVMYTYRKLKHSRNKGCQESSQ